MQQDVPTWVSGQVGAKIAETNRKAIYRMAAAGKIRSRRLPGCKVQFHRADLERIAQQAINT